MADPIPAGVRARLAGLRLTTRLAAGTRGVGLHASRARGTGLEFAQYRAYEPGDEPRQIDWKLYARADKFFVREAERESPVALWVLIDASASMRQADAPRPDWTRLAAAKALAACLAELALAGGDRFGWATLSDAGVKLDPPAAGVRHRDRFWLGLAGIEAAGGWPDADAIAPMLERIGARDLVVLVSDFFDPQAAALLTRLAAAGREGVAIQVLTVAERDFPFAAGHRFRDPESGDELLGDGPALRAAFLARFGAARVALATELAAAGVRLASYILDEPLDQPLRALFGRSGGA